MALIWIDGFDSYGLAGTNPWPCMTTEGYQLPSGLTTTPQITANARTGQAYAIQCWSQGNGDFAIMRPLAEVETELWLGFAFQYAPVTGATNFIRFDKRYLGNVYAQMAVGVNNSGQVTVTQMSSNENPGDGTIVATSSSNVLFPGTWYYVEVHYVFNAAAGTCEVRVDNTVVVTYSGNTTTTDDTIPQTDPVRYYTAPGIDYVMLGGQGSYSFTYFDDLYILDNASGLTGYLGDHAVVTAFPANDAGPNQWTPSSGANNYALLADMENDGTYVYATTYSLSEAYGLTALPTSVIGVTAAQVHVRAQRDSASGMTLEVQATGASDTVSSSAFSLGTSYAGYDLFMEKNADGGDWTVSTAQATIIGFESIT